jgi:hypothetical protein
MTVKQLLERDAGGLAERAGALRRLTRVHDRWSFPTHGTPRAPDWW